MGTTTGRICSALLALLIVLSMISPMVVTTARSSSSSSSMTLPMQPGDFSMYNDPNAPLDFYYDSSRITDINSVISGSEAAYNMMKPYFGTFGYRFRIIVAANNLQYDDIVNANLNVDNLSDTSVASNWASGERSTIVIESPDNMDNFTSTMAQQMAYIEVRTNYVNGQFSMPDWFTEGLATYISGNISDSARSTVEQLCRQERLMTIDKMEEIEEHASDPMADPGDLIMADDQSALVIEYVGSKYGNDSIRQILSNFGASGDLDTAFIQTIGSNPDDINAEWKSDLKSELNIDDGVVLQQQVNGYVLDPDGNPLSDVTVSFKSLRNDSSVFGKLYSKTTDTDGYYQLNLTYGPFTAYVSTPGYNPIDDSNITIGKNEVKSFNFTFKNYGLVASNGSLTSEPLDVNVIYMALFVVNAAAVLLVAFLFMRARK